MAKEARDMPWNDIKWLENTLLKQEMCSGGNSGRYLDKLLRLTVGVVE
jgi:hypothetical protein